ncbi:MAG: hypothetical protein P8O70_10925 [SAR324 cluster bacterium]|nr:hypothetical protein [SAR324 cluster bacterium]
MIPEIHQQEFQGLFGVAVAEINPPTGMYSRTWGYSEHDVADGIHRPLRASCLTISGASEKENLTLLALDLMAWLSSEDEECIRVPLEEEFKLKPGSLLTHLSHSHGAPFTEPLLADAPGGHLIRGYRKQILKTCRQLISEAFENKRVCVLSWGVGRCGMAFNRDLTLPETGDHVVGINPSKVADDTLLVGRITEQSGVHVASLVHYAAHPTSLGGMNRLISPDYVGAMRELVERDTNGAPCIFLHGADGELAPRRCYEESTEAADQNGRELGYAALSTLSGLMPSGQKMVFDKKVESGATLGLWKYEDKLPDHEIDMITETLELKLGDIPSVDTFKKLVEAKSGFEKERAQRGLALREKLGDSSTYDFPIYVWKLGKTIMVGAPIEFYNEFQIFLRRQFPENLILVLDICNGFLNYLPRKEEFARKTYQVKIALFAQESEERVRTKVVYLINQLLNIN